MRGKRAVWSTAGGLLVVFGLIGFAHTRSGKPMLAWLARSAGVRCPLGFDVTLSPADRDRNAVAFAAKYRGSAPAGARPVLAFGFDSIRADVQAWAATHHVDCGKPAAGFDMECRSVPAAALPKGFDGMPISSLWLDFGSKGTLLSATTVRNGTSAEEASRTFHEITEALVKNAGPAWVTRGDGSAQMLALGPLSQSVAEFRFQDYYAIVRVTNGGRGRFNLTEVYRALPAEAAIATQ